VTHSAAAMATPHGSIQYPQQTVEATHPGRIRGRVAARGALLQHAQHHDPTRMQADRHCDVAGEHTRQAQDQSHRQPRQERINHQRRVAQGREREQQQIEAAAPAHVGRRDRRFGREMQDGEPRCGEQARPSTAPIHVLRLSA